jgi:hypothetical protein
MGDCGGERGENEEGEEGRGEVVGVVGKGTEYG